MSSALLKQALTEFEKLPVEDQNALAARWLEEVRDERLWAEKFVATTDEQWDRLADLVKRDIAEGDTTSLDDFLDETTAE